MKHSLFPALLIPFFLVLAASAQAADDEQAPRGWLHYHDGPHGPGFDNERSAKPNGIAVYGWVYRGPTGGRATAYGSRSCGAYHYWDGDACADARQNPPNSP